MGKIAFLSTLLAFLLAYSAAEAFISQRSAWWNMRLDELAEKKAELSKKAAAPIDRSIIALMDRETARGRDTLELFKKNTSAETRAISIEEIRTYIHQSLLPLYSLRCLESIIESAGNDQIISASRAVFARRSEGQFRSLMAHASPGASADAPARPGREEADLLALELSIGGVINQYDAKYRETAAAVERDVMAAAAPRENGHDVAEIRAIIRESAAAKCAALTLVNNETLSGALEQSWTWRGAAVTIERDAKIASEINRLFAAAEIPAPSEKSGYFARNTLSLDQLYFGSIAEKYQARFDGTRPGAKKGAPPEAFRLPEFAKITRAVDVRRRKVLQGITGGENEQFFITSTAGLRGAAAKYTRPVEKKIEACEQGECENAAEIPQARKSLAAQQKLADEYAGESVPFVRWVSKSRSVNGAEVLADYRYRADRTVSYINFIRSLAEKSAGIAAMHSPDHHMKFAVYIKNAPVIFSKLQASCAIDRAVLPALTAEENSEIRGLRAGVTAAAGAAQRDISAAYTSYHARHGELNRTRAAKEGRRDAGIAQYDMDQMAATLNDYVALYGTLSYSDRALKRYHDMYRKLEGAEGGPQAAMRDRAVRTGSIIPLLDDFDTAAMVRENAARAYLKKEIQVMVSRIRSIANLFRQYDISTSHIMSQADAARLLDRLDKSPQAPVADWMMNETNAAEIDRKAVEKLARAGMKRDWRPLPAGDKNPPAGTAVELEGFSLKFTIPEGWTEDRADSYHNERGIFKVYRSRDNTSSIEVARISPPHESPLNELSLTWHRKIGSRVMKGKWGRQDGKDYYWTIARDQGRQVRESYAFGDGPHTVIISGSTPRERYGFFRKKLEGVINSMNK
jgi:hypothetical protein